MNAYPSPEQVRTQQTVAAFLNTHSNVNGATLTALERQRRLLADAEAAWFLKQHGVLPASAASLVATMRRSIGAALVRAGERIAGAPRSADLPETAPAAAATGL